MRKVCHVTSVHERYDTRIFHKECKSLRKAGYQVSLIVNDDIADEEIDGVKILSTKFQPSNRIERFLKGYRMVKNKIREVDAEIYHFHDPELLFLALSLKRKGKKVIFDSHENIREDIKDKEYIPKRIRVLISKLYGLFEGYVLKRIDAVIGVSLGQMKLLGQIGNNATMITNFPELVNIKARSKDKREGICFAGGINSYWSHEKIIDVLEDVKVKYMMCGPTDENYLHYLKGHRNWKYVEYKGIIKHENVEDFLGGSIAGMALLRPVHNMDKEGTLGNTKLFEYMRAGIPVIATDFSLWKEIINENKCGICVDINNRSEILNAIRYLSEHEEEARIMGENGQRIFVEKYNWETQVPILLDLYKKIMVTDG